jgi:hypothetical protein
MPLDADVEALIAKYEKLDDMLVKLYPEAVPGLIVDSTMEMAMETLSERPSRLQTLVSSYEMARIQFSMIAPDAKIQPEYIECRGGSQPSEYVQIADRLKISCATALAFLRTLTSRIPARERDKVNSLRDQISPLESFDANLFKHLILAVEEYENAHFLASALLAGKSVVYVLSRLPGTSDEEKVNNLVKSGAVKQQLKDKSLNAARRARNYFSHDMSAFAEPSDALNSISDAVDFSLKWKSTVKS